MQKLLTSLCILADETHLFVEDHNPDPNLRSHLEHTNDETGDVAIGDEGQTGSEEDEESDGSESDEALHMLDEVMREGEVGAEGERVEVEEGEHSHELKGNTKEYVKRNKRKGVRTIQRVIGAKRREDGEVLRRRVSQGRLVHRTRRVSIQQRVRLSSGRSQRTPRKQ